ncbi:hypothetical protein O5O45_26325 [Hahella aquimaris]|uniref:hypothetical protein n=1 Tax=Hahella sp. HNIBRBA332 TaxID=3015983 RepID=UPI00273B369A|nr:hypothetical protein [Hahella sp. HNIBRBA332]WLQ13251.1 hypothetical protein O5O45_26325 [Hahella sp. HNIBRBA332]
MKAPLVDNAWQTIGEEQFKPCQALKGGVAKMKQLKKVTSVIQQNEGNQKVESVLRYTCLMHALSKCKDAIEDAKDPICEERFRCLHAHVTSELFEAQQKVDSELGHLDL